MMTSLIIGVYASVWKLLFLTHINLAHLVDQPDFGDFAIPDVTSHDDSIHGGVKMGVLDDTCDNGKERLAVDLAQRRQMVRVCPLYDRIPVPQCGHLRRAHSAEPRFPCKTPKLICSKKADMPIHECMDTAIFYDDKIPTSGAHRPIWPEYGEYFYVPPQRWIHSLEHGAAVFLYHPCADLEQLRVFKTLATTCLRRHIITPYNLTQELKCHILTPFFTSIAEIIFMQEGAIFSLPTYLMRNCNSNSKSIDLEQYVNNEKNIAESFKKYKENKTMCSGRPFAILTWACRLMLDRVDNNIPIAVKFLKNKSIKTYESNVFQDGDYSYLLKKKAALVSDEQDSHVCPDIQV